ncbi:hypothetical protein E2P81_ATG02456 [Venturia nashicola]|uniref:MARVEL domain-containing protein n=1 Tax=Venturia nashicola TaxID=86259 RepID=A0A4Z1PKZ1_9PEZI|nr:hypothetical protein E6O75_ATG02515 [Venturia nashicola]TLD36674.1 hypothetical protein E2P81_ATG02456 [Venturia nashicola]
MAFGGTALKLVQTFLYTLLFCCSAIILGIYSYFLAVQADHNSHIPKWQKAVEGMSGVAVIYTIFAIVLTCCLGGKAFFAFLAIVLDLLLCGAFIAIAVLTRNGSRSCSGNNVRSPLGTGPSGSKAGYGSGGFGTGNNQNVTYSASYGFACRLNKVCFAVAIIGAFLFLLSALTQLWLGRHHKREKRYGPSPTNNYTAGSGGSWFKRRRGAKAGTSPDDELGGAGLAAHHVHNANGVRTSHETGFTGTTAEGTYAGEKYEAPHATQPAIPTNGGYHTGPTGTAVNPYGATKPAVNY